MTRFRSVLFWLHLVSGVLAGVVVLIMSVTGVALTYEKQMLEWADRRAWSAPPSADTARLSPETLLARVREARPEAVPTTLTLRADPSAPATLALDGVGPLLVEPFTGAVIGPPPAGLRTFFRTMTNWHRWLALEGTSRPVGKAVTGAANLAFLFIVLSGIYLWVPRVWSRLQFRNVLWFRRGLTSKARDFNWHNVIGIWSAVPLAIVVAGAVPISYPWASNLVYRLAGEAPPQPSGAPRPGSPAGAGARGAARGGDTVREPRAPLLLEGLDQRFATADRQIAGWRAMTIRLPQAAGQPYVFTIDEGYGGQPQKRGTLTINQASGAVEKWETFADQSAGRRLRSWFRFAHTGEYYGLTGQTIAGIVSAGGVVLVWTGVALAWRRFRAWTSRRPTTAASAQKVA
ncbi:MAG: PepSY domain-containing protein [Acidobacteria bacterium]|nr:PepSY domain-containing protein [Acidobacteriota bacterium]